MFRRWRENFLVLEGALAVAAAAVFVAWDARSSGAALDALLVGNRAPIYGTLATTSGCLFGFSITTIAILVSFAPVEPFRKLAEHVHYPELWRIYKGSMRWLAASTVAVIIALIVDRDSVPRHWAVYLVVVTHLLALVRMARAVWSLEHVVAILTARKG
jgi:hypothetical protein